MFTYFILGLLLIIPIHSQQLKPQSVFYYAPTSPYVQGNVYPFLNYPNPNEPPTFGKALQSVQTPNELLFYPNTEGLMAQRPIFVSHQTANVPVGKFTAPPSELLDAVYAWFHKNNIPIPDAANKNDLSLEKNETKQLENTEAEVLTETDKNPNINFPKKPVSPKFRPGQRFYVLNDQPQFYNNFQPELPPHQSVVPQFLTRSAIPSDTPNILIFQPHNQDTQQQILGQDQIQSEIKPIRYHDSEVRQQNFVLLQEKQERNNPHLHVQSLMPTYSRQQLLIGRFLPHSQNLKQQQITQNPVHQTHYVPVEVVPPQVPAFQSMYPTHKEQEVTQETDAQQLAVIHIPVDQNIQLPHYIKQKQVPILQNFQNSNPEKPILYLSPEVQTKTTSHTDQNNENLENQNSQFAKKETEIEGIPPGIAALDFARYLASRQENLYSDSVVVDVKSDEDDNNNSNSNKEENNDSTHSDIPEETPAEPTIAQAQPSAIALAGRGGVASTAPRGTAYAGDKGLAVSKPQATAVAGPKSDKTDKE